MSPRYVLSTELFRCGHLPQLEALHLAGRGARKRVHEVDALRPLVESPALRREVGAASRAYVERVHDIDEIADRLLDVYARLER